MQSAQEMALVQRQKRYDLKTSVKARLHLAPHGTSLIAYIVNISKSGLSLRCREPIPDDADVYLLLHDQHVHLIQVWELPAPKGSLAYGFKSARRNIDLVRMFVSAGLPISKAKEKIQSDEEHFVEEFSTIEFEAFPAA